jgi:dethiobiotin synthetase
VNIIVAGIGTEVGKTIVSAILCEALTADYWKPVQAGSLDNTDSHLVSKLLRDTSECRVWPEAVCLTKPMSPHAAAEIDQVEISLDSINLPKAQNHLVIELAGGLMVPLSSSVSNVDLVKKLACPVVLVSSYYLGSINHTLLSLYLLKSENIPVLGVIFNGETNTQSKEIILRLGSVSLLGEIPQSAHLDSTFIKYHAENIRQHPTMARL